MAPVPQHNDAQKYREHGYDSVNYKVETTGESFIVHSYCPQCSVDTDFEINSGTAAFGYKLLPSRAERILFKADDVVTSDVATIICACGYAHEGRAADSEEDGCGAYWQATLPSEG